MNDFNLLNADLLSRLREVRNVLESHDIQFALVGGLAVTVWGAARSTYDIDFAVASNEPDIAKLRLAIASSSVFAFEPEDLTLTKLTILRAHVHNRDRSDLISVDFLCLDPEFAASLLSRRIMLPFAGTMLSIASPEDLLILKLQSGRAKDLEDARSILCEQVADLDRNYFSQWLDRFGLWTQAESIGLARD